MAILSDGIFTNLPEAFKKTKILYDKITYVKLHFIMTGANG